MTDKNFTRELNQYKKWSSLFTGRPNWKRIFVAMRQNYVGADIGVFLCGPRPIAVQLQSCCKKFSDDRPTKKEEQETVDKGGKKPTFFTFHQENF